MADTLDSSALGEDPLVGFHFSLDLKSGTELGYFTEVSGIGAENEVVEQKMINSNGGTVIVKVPGRLKWEDITLKRGITSKMDIWDWRDLVNQGNVDQARSNGTITMYDQQLNPVARWDFINGWPSKVTGPALNVDDDSFGIEEITIAHEGIERKS